ncbi:hypothetical protein GCM10007079_49190 [Nocardiopsis terrae]|uniref:ABC-2 type transport system permease protein n=1 Tax=Nocardiopsis terrae TaxID=372655 RepID=A0ABR9HAA8_9ACTN|nr:hypothetical protein [Nocardiopsis terrae]MBE1455964.1 ABC-2 type transport system permease protein [Nocardiopsis terrae]GHC96474.1 hypothetical protein GCM10007079_49190 [Nocardiopsis terrae]
MVQMKLSVLRHGSSNRRTLGGVIGLALALATIAISVFAPIEVAPSLLAAVVGVWVLGWIVGPSGAGGGDESLKPEYFALEPIQPRTVAVGLLAASFVGVTVPVTLAAFLSLLTLGIRFGFLAALVALIAVPLQVVFAVLASRLVMALTGAALRTRIGVEITAVQYAAVLATGFSVYMLYQAASQHGDVLGQIWAQGLPAPYGTLVLALPSGWGAAAVQAAGQGGWAVALGAVAGLAVVNVLLLLGWSALIHQRVTRPTTRPSRGGRRVSGLIVGALPSTPLGAVVGRELRTWGSDPRRALELRIALWTGVLICALGLLVGLTFMIPLSGLITIALAALMSLNIYALDGSALWQTLLTPGAERSDVRGRQIAWLVVFVPPAVLVSLGGMVLTGQSWALPWVSAALPALVGGGAGLIVLFAVAWPAPGPEPHRHGGNPLDSGDVVAQFNVMFPLMIVTAVPPTIVTAAGYFLEIPALMWSGTAVGVLWGLLLGWGLGRVAYRRLEKRGPELLGTLRWGASAGADGEEESEDEQEDKPEAEWAFVTRIERNVESMSSGRGAVLAVLGCTFWLPIYQGAASLFRSLGGAGQPGWHLPLYLPGAWQVPGSLVMLAAGVFMVYLIGRILLGPAPAAGSGESTPETDGNRGGDRSDSTVG